MNVANPPIHRIASAYGVTRQRLHQLRREHGLTIEQLADPTQVFDKLLDKGRACKLRSRLRDPDTRAALQIDLLAIRGPVPPIEAKIQSIK